MNTLILPINPEEGDILKTEHVCFFARKSSAFEGAEFKINLYEVVNETWKHPQSDCMTINKLDYRFVGSFNRQSIDAAGTVLLEACENVLIEKFPKEKIT